MSKDTFLHIVRVLSTLVLCFAIGRQSVMHYGSTAEAQTILVTVSVHGKVFRNQNALVGR